MTLYCHPMVARRSRLAVASFMASLATRAKDHVAMQAWFAELFDKVLQRAQMPRAEVES